MTSEILLLLSSHNHDLCDLLQNDLKTKNKFEK